MKKMVLGALCIVLGFAANAAVTRVRIKDLYYLLDDSTKTAEVTSGPVAYSMTTVEIPTSVTEGVESYAVTSIGHGAFQHCNALKSVSAPSVTSIGELAFSYCKSLESVDAPFVISIGRLAFDVCHSLTSLTVNSVMKDGWDSNKGNYGLSKPASGFMVTFYTPPPVKVVPNPAANSTAKVYANGVEVTSNPIVVLSNAWVDVVFEAQEGYCFADDYSTTRTNTVQATDEPTEVEGPKVVKAPPMSMEETQQAGYEVKEAEFETTVSVTVVADPSVTLKSNGQEISEEDYAKACEFYGIEQKTKPDVPSTPTAEDFKVVSKDAQVVPAPPAPPAGAVTSWNALTNAVATAATGATVAVGADITEDGGELVVPAGKAVTIKLYGKTVTCAQVTVNGALSVGDADDSVGRIVATGGAKLAKSGSVAILGGPMLGTFTVLTSGVTLLFK